MIEKRARERYLLDFGLNSYSIYIASSGAIPIPRFNVSAPIRKYNFNRMYW